MAGDTGLLHAREGSDQLLWTRYDTGATTDTGLRLPARVPQSGVRAVVLKVTVTDAKDGGHLTVWPSGSERPNSSKLNWTATVANLVTVPVGADGKVEIADLGWGSAHVIVDLFGYLG
ncbi:hypothetical protein ABZX75_16235 [Streptomyces sp. NPDC003038]|uniref:hypothetical protein n=1 Tax=unclassified Streptomyces TaxID=2593676 RepID=UPI00339E5037